MTQDVIHVGGGEHRGGLSVFPLWQRTRPGTPVALADERTVAVAELDAPTVPQLRVRPVGPRPVLLLDGLALRGGWQDRTVLASTLLAPGREEVVEVRCVEEERWGGATEHAPRGRSSLRVRTRHDQHAVWEQVARERARQAEPPDVTGLEPLPGQCGVLVGIGGRPLSVELFAHPDLLARAFPDLIAAAARDAAGAAPRRTTAHDARGFAQAAAAVVLAAGERAGLGRRTSGECGPLAGRGLTWEGRALHTCVLDRSHAAVAA